MLPLQLSASPGRPLSLLAVGAHPDDVEIGMGGMLLSLAGSRPRVRYVVLTGTPERQQEAASAACAFPPCVDPDVELFDLPENRLPAARGQVRRFSRACRGWARPMSSSPLRQTTPHHQDHRTIGEIVPTIFRDQLFLAYEIPKWDGDLGRPSVYFPLSADIARRKVELLHKCLPSQCDRDWWDDEVFLGIAHLRGMECRAPYAEAFSCAKSVPMVAH